MSHLNNVDLCSTDSRAATLSKRQTVRDKARCRAWRSGAQMINRIFAGLVSWFSRPGVIVDLDPTFDLPPHKRSAQPFMPNDWWCR